MLSSKHTMSLYSKVCQNESNVRFVQSKDNISTFTQHIEPSALAAAVAAQWKRTVYGGGIGRKIGTIFSCYG